MMQVRQWLIRVGLAAGLLGLVVSGAYAQSASLLPNGQQQFADANGAPYAGGLVYFYIPGTTSSKTTWVDPNQQVANTNPVVLNSAGRAIIYGSGQYRQVLVDQFGNTIWDQLTDDVLGSLVRQTILFGGTSTGTANAQAIAPNPAISGYSTGQAFDFIAGATNTGALTLAVNGQGPKAVTVGTGATTGGEVVAGNLVVVVYDGTELQIVGNSPLLNVKQFGAMGNGSTDDTAAVQGALAGCQAIGGCTLWFPVGHYYLSQPIGISGDGVYLAGASRTGTHLVFHNGSGNGLVFHGSAQINGEGVRDLTVENGGTPTGGALISADTVAFLEVENVEFDNAWEGLALAQTNTVEVKDVNINATVTGAQFGIKWSSPVGANASGLDLTNVVVQALYSGADGLDWDGFATTMTMHNVALLSTKYGFHIENSAASTTAYPSFLQAQGLQIDGATVTALQIDGGFDFHFGDADVSNTSGAGGQGSADLAAVVILADAGASATRGVYFTGAKLGNTQRQAIVSGAQDVYVVGSTLSDTSKAGIGSYPVVELTGSAGANLFVGNKVGVVFGEGLRPSYGFQLDSGADANVFASNTFQGNQTGDYLDNSGSLTNVFGQSLGRDLQRTKLVNSENLGLTAAGSTQGTALVLTAAINEVTTTASSTGVVLPSVEAGTGPIWVANYGANTLSLYPPSGGQINRAGTNAAISMSAGVSVELFCTSAGGSQQCYTVP